MVVDRIGATAVGALVVLALAAGVSGNWCAALGAAVSAVGVILFIWEFPP